MEIWSAEVRLTVNYGFKYLKKEHTTQRINELKGSEEGGCLLCLRNSKEKQHGWHRMCRGEREREQVKDKVRRDEGLGPHGLMKRFSVSL